MSLSLAEVIAQTLLSFPNNDIPSEDMLLWNWRTGIVEQHCMPASWLESHGSLDSHQLLLSLAAVNGSEMVAFDEPSWRSKLLQAKPQLRPLILCLDSVAFASLPERQEAQTFVDELANKQLRDYNVVLWRTAFVLAKLVSLSGYQACGGHPRIVSLLRLVCNKINDDSTDSPAASDEVELLCKLLVKVLLTMMQQSAKRYNGSQHQGSMACCLLARTVAQQAHLRPILAEAMLSSGMQHVHKLSLKCSASARHALLASSQDTCTCVRQ